MALFSERTDRYAQKLLDTADIVREAVDGEEIINSGRTPPVAGISLTRLALNNFCVCRQKRPKRRKS
jgi:hypothetical protein